MFTPMRCFACLFSNHVFPSRICIKEQNIHKQPLTDVLQELRRSLDFFRTSGKFSIATMNRGGEKEYFLCCGCEEIYIPPTANLTLKGFMVAGKHEHHEYHQPWCCHANVTVWSGLLNPCLAQ